MSIEMSEAEYGSSNGENGFSGLRIEADVKAVRKLIVRRMWFHMVEVGLMCALRVLCVRISWVELRTSVV